MEQTKAPKIGAQWPTRLFGTYDRRADLDRLQSGTSRWARPVSGVKAWSAIVVTFLTVCGAIVTKSMDGPAAPKVVRDTIGDRQRIELAGRVTDNSARLASAERRIDALERVATTNLY